MNQRVLFSMMFSVLLLTSQLWAGDSCKVSKLQGSYAGTVSGQNTSGMPVASQAIAHFDGAGKFFLTGFTEVQNGIVLVANASASGGTYTVNADCSGVIQIATPAGTVKFNILLTGRGLSQFQMVETDGAATTAGNAVLQDLTEDHN